jgi:pantoate--beta-alanine ligase
MIHPASGWTLVQLLRHLDHAPRYVAIAAAETESSRRLTEELCQALGSPRLEQQCLTAAVGPDFPPSEGVESGPGMAELLQESRWRRSPELAARLPRVVEPALPPVLSSFWLEGARPGLVRPAVVIAWEKSAPAQAALKIILDRPGHGPMARIQGEDFPMVLSEALAAIRAVWPALRVVNINPSADRTVPTVRARLMHNTKSLKVIRSPSEVQASVLAAKSAGDRVGFVPTMGAFHEGHLSLVEASLAECDRTVVSIFVNPTQFDPGEDLEKYPRPLEQDLELLEQRGVWLAFVPTVDEMYPSGFDSYVDVGSVAQPWEGAARPTHFRGVATIVLKLLQMVPADCAYFGRKDYQQTLVVRQLIEDFNLPIALRVCPIVREADGLAMSSRNAYLDRIDRERASALRQALLLAEQKHAAGETSVATIRGEMTEYLTTKGVEDIEYIAFLADSTVREVLNITGPTVVAIAARFGRARLIDNHTIG